MSVPKRVLVIPAFNEARHLSALLERVRAAAGDFEVVVVDDGSQDETAEVAIRCGARVLRHPCNLGYGAALQTGYKYADRVGADLVVQMDADGQHDPADLAALAAPVEKDELDLVIGSRFLPQPEGTTPSSVPDYRMGLLREAGRRLFCTLGRWMGLRVTDPTSGLQALNRRTLRLYVQDFFPSDYPDVDVLVLAYRSGLRIGERRVAMTTGWRPSLLHGGLAPLYYVYKMLLSLWVGLSRPGVREASDGRDGDDAS